MLKRTKAYHVDNNISNYFKNPFFIGLVTNLLNPKATLFFISLFALVIDVNTSVYLQVFYGIWMSVITGLWFCLVSLLISSYYLKIFINKYSILVNFSPKKIGPFISECLITGFHRNDNAVVLAIPDKSVPNGSLLA